MDIFRQINFPFFFTLIIILSPPITVVEGEEPNNIEFKQEKTSATQRLRFSWETVKSLMNQLQTQFFPPNLDFRSGDEARSTGGSEDGARERMKEAAGKSFGAGKVAVEESAKSAAKVVGEAVHKTAEKVKEKMPGGDDSDTEL